MVIITFEMFSVGPEEWPSLQGVVLGMTELSMRSSMVQCLERRQGKTGVRRGWKDKQVTHHAEPKLRERGIA